MFRYHLLGLLRKNDLHGYALMKEYQRRSGVPVAPGAFYRELRVLLRDGQVERLASGKTAPRRTPYRITERGDAAFGDWFDGIPDSTSCGENELAFRLLFFAEVSPERAARVLELWRRGLSQLTRDIETDLQRKTTRGLQNGDSAILLLQRRLDHAAADLKFLESVRNALELPAIGSDALQGERMQYARRRGSTAG